MLINVANVKGHSLNKINNDIISSLSSYYEFTDDKKADIFIQHYVASIPNYPYKKTILIQPIDGTIINPIHVKNMNKYNLILAPSNSSKDIMEKNGVRAPIQVIPNYYDSSLLKEDNGYFSRRYHNKKYTFYSDTTAINRKNVENIVKYFLEEFASTPESNNVRLVMKLSSDNTQRINNLRKMISEYDSNIEVDILNSWLKQDDINSLIKGSDCYISLSYMEGFCIPLLNAAFLKKDIITLRTKISGYVDFIDDKNAVLVNTKIIPIDTAHESLLIYDKKSIWEEPNYLEYKAAMRKVLNGSYFFDKTRDYSYFSIENVIKMYKEAIISEIANIKIDDTVTEEVKPLYKFSIFSPKFLRTI